MRKLLAILLSGVMVFALVACGGKNTEDPENTKAPSNGAEGEITTNLFTLAYDDSIWINVEESLTNDEDYCFANLQILDPDDPEYYLIDADIEVSVDEPYDFREDLVYYGFNQYEYKVNNTYETVNIGGVDLLKYDDGEETLVYLNRIEGAGATVTIEFDAQDITDSRIADLLNGLKFTLEDAGNVDGPWEWEGEAFSTEDHSVNAGAFTVDSKLIPFEECITTFETFNHSVAAVGDKVYVLVDGELRECHYDGTELVFVQVIELPEDDYERINSSADGSLWLSGSMNDILRIKDGSVVNTYEDIDSLAIHPSGTWGVDYFTSNE
ncbi:MAG: hypothetical protein IJO13_05925, partial [Lachnospiraceae bacterium]|nr:hypothetical protein [Lachnospiraceae bacterium]